MIAEDQPTKPLETHEIFTFSLSYDTIDSKLLDYLQNGLRQIAERDYNCKELCFRRWEGIQLTIYLWYGDKIDSISAEISGYIDDTPIAYETSIKPNDKDDYRALLNIALKDLQRKQKVIKEAIQNIQLS